MKPTFHLVFRTICFAVGFLAQQSFAQLSPPLDALAKDLGKAAARRDAIHDTEQEARALKAPTGILGARWLMAPADVQAIRPKTVSAGPEALTENAEVYGRPAAITYSFKGDALLLVILSFRDQPTAADFTTTQKILEAEYGPMPKPTESEDYLLDSYKAIDRFVARHTYREHLGTPIEQIQLFRTSPKHAASQTPVLPADEQPKKIKPRTAAWLERGCHAILNVDKERAKAGDEQIQTGTQMAVWLHGWMAGVQTSSIVSHDLQKTPPLLDPPNDWYDQAKIAASVVRFYDEYRADIDPDIPAYALMICWYRVAHPQAPERYKASTRESLRDMADLATKTKR